MKLLSSASTLVIATTLSFASASVMAKNVVLKPTDQKLATEVCIAAADEGLIAARALVRANKLNFSTFKATVSCNGLSLREFAETYGKKQSETEMTASRIKLVPKNENVESQLCLDAVTMGEQAAREKYSIDAPVICNNRELGDFVRNFSSQTVLVSNTED
jgi:hypothetical protein